MAAYYSDDRGRYSTGESYDWFWRYDEDPDVEILTSSDGLWTYTCIDGGIEVLRYNSDDIHIIVPDVIDSKKVICLDSTFDGFHELKSLVIPDGVTTIVGICHGCEGLEKVELPKGLLDMEYAFSNCYSLKNLEIPSSVEFLSFSLEDTQLKQLIFSQGTKNIFCICRESEFLEYVFIPKSVYCTDDAFSYCEILSKVVLEDGLEKIGDYTFFHCLSLLELTIPESVIEIGKNSVGIMEKRVYTMPDDKSCYSSRGEMVVPGFKIKGVLGSVAEKYANENGIEFISL